MDLGLIKTLFFTAFFVGLFHMVPAPVPRCSPLIFINKLAEASNILSDSNPYFPVGPCEYGGPLQALRYGDARAVFVLAEPLKIPRHNFYEFIWLLKTGGPRLLRILNGKEKLVFDRNILREGYKHYTPYVRTQQIGQYTKHNPKIIDSKKLYTKVVGSKIRQLIREGPDKYINKHYTFQGGYGHGHGHGHGHGNGHGGKGKGHSSGSYGAPSSGYGAPSSGYGAPSSGYGAPSSGYGAPSSGYGAPSSGYGAPSSGYGAPSSGYGAPSSGYGAPSSGYGAPSSSHGSPSSSYGAPSSSYGAPSSGYGAPSTGSDYSAPSSSYNADDSSYSAPSTGHSAPSSSYNGPSSGYSAPSSGYSAPSSGYSAPRNFNSLATNSNGFSSTGSFGGQGVRTARSNKNLVADNSIPALDDISSFSALVGGGLDGGKSSPQARSSPSEQEAEPGLYNNYASKSISIPGLAIPQPSSIITSNVDPLTDSTSFGGDQIVPGNANGRTKEASLNEDLPPSNESKVFNSPTVGNQIVLVEDTQFIPSQFPNEHQDRLSASVHGITTLQENQEAQQTTDDYVETVTEFPADGPYFVSQ